VGDHTRSHRCHRAVEGTFLLGWRNLNVRALAITKRHYAFSVHTRGMVTIIM
jgi:hypothetical protein